jgi:hypothetical protein
VIKCLKEQPDLRNYVRNVTMKQEQENPKQEKLLKNNSFYGYRSFSFIDSIDIQIISLLNDTLLINTSRIEENHKMPLLMNISLMESILETQHVTLKPHIDKLMGFKFIKMSPHHKGNRKNYSLTPKGLKLIKFFVEMEFEMPIDKFYEITNFSNRWVKTSPFSFKKCQY